MNRILRGKMIFSLGSFVILKLFRSISVFLWFYFTINHFIALKEKKTFDYGLRTFLYFIFFLLQILLSFESNFQKLAYMSLSIILLWFFHNNFLIFGPTWAYPLRHLQAACAGWWKLFVYRGIRFISTSSSSSHVYGQQTSGETPITFFLFFFFSFLLAIYGWPFKFTDYPFKLFFLLILFLLFLFLFF
jgi:hypothetical protein